MPILGREAGTQVYRDLAEHPEDETDPEHNRVSCFSPLAKALMSKQVGESVIWQRPIGDIELTVLGIESDDR